MGLLMLQSCGEEFKPSRPAHLCSYELTGANGRDTINLTDNKGLKQGMWIMKKKLGYKTYKVVIKDTTIWKADEVIEIDTFYYKNGLPVKN